ncbi:hypothetical protein LTR42_005915 [Elasticomyces elasticus]|nr:hypothetical protein LTR42_005915 [Elasticomyces elasticus]
MAVPAINRQPSPNGLSLNLSSNNPFRNRATSPPPTTNGGVPSPQLVPPPHNPQRRMSRNPFLDASEIPTAAPAPKGSNVSGGLTEDIFVRVSRDTVLPHDMA